MMTLLTTTVAAIGAAMITTAPLNEMDGLSYYQAGEAIAEAVYTQCPQFVGLIQAFTHAETTQA